MSAGAIHAPLIIPLRIPVAGVPQSRIDNQTRLEIISDTPNADVYYTVNGRKPVVGKNERELINSGTIKFKIPFKLDAGLRVVRAIAVQPETGSQSNIVTKSFEVTKVDGAENGSQSGRGDFEFLEDLKAIEKHRPRSGKPPSNSRSSSQDSMRASKRKNRVASQLTKQSSLQSTERLKADRSAESLISDRSISTSRNNLIREFEVPLKSSTEQTPTSKQFYDASRTKYVPRCPRCTNVLQDKPFPNYCSHCEGSPPVFYSMEEASADSLGQCPTCRSTVPLNFPNCVVCGHAFVANKTQIDRNLCQICGSTKPPNVASCPVCQITDYQNGLNNCNFRPGLIGSSLPSSPARSLRNSPFQQQKQNSMFCPRCGKPIQAHWRFCGWCRLGPTSDPQQFASEDCAPHPFMASGDFNVMNHPNMHRQIPPSNLQMMAFKFCPCCGSQDSANSRFCSNCGSSINQSTYLPYSLPHQNSKSAMTFSKPVNLQIANAATQTVGLFYPSSAELRRRGSVPDLDSSVDRPARQSTPLLTPVSPGRGFWRKQLDHLSSHLKLYVTNNPEFRVQIGEPRFGKLLSADLHESDGKATIQLIYNLPNTQARKLPPRQSNRKPTTAHSKPEVTEPIVSQSNSLQLARHNSTESFELVEPDTYPSDEEPTISSAGQDLIGNTDCNPSEGCSTSSVLVDQQESQSSVKDRPPSGRTNPKKKIKSHDQLTISSQSNTSGQSSASTTPRQSTKQKKKVTGPSGEAGVAELRHSKLTVADKKLIKILNDKEDSTQNDLITVLNQGANPNCIDSEGRTPLLLAVANKNVGAIPVLIKHGAKVNMGGASTGNTALHEAVSLGRNGIELTDVLLRHGASLKATNKQQLTPYTLALKKNSEPLNRLILSYMGETQLKRLTEDAFRQSSQSNVSQEAGEF